MTAHRQYRAGEFKDAVNAANRAFETMLKLIADFEKWPYPKGARAPELVTVVSKGGLFTRRFDKGLETYVVMLKTGLGPLAGQKRGWGAWRRASGEKVRRGLPGTRSI